MEEFNIIANVSSEKPVETISSWKTNNKLYYIIIWLLSLSLVISVYFVNNNYQKNQLLNEGITKLNNDNTAKNTTIVSLNNDIAKLNIEMQNLKKKDKSIAQVDTNNTESDALTEYQKRSRDIVRTTDIRELRMHLAAYEIDSGIWAPEMPISGCIPWKDILGKYLVKIPTDPIKWRYSSGCDGSDGMSYAYRKYSQSWAEWIHTYMILSAELEQEGAGNSTLSIDEVMALEDPIRYIDEPRYWSGKYFIIRN